MARSNKQHLDRARAKLNELFDELEQVKPRLESQVEKLHADAKQKLDKLRAKIDAIKFDE